MASTTQSHMMKTTKRGRPHLKDTSDLFSTLIISLPMNPHRHFFKSYPNSFTTDEAAQNLSSLKFSQSQRAADPKDPTRIMTTTTTTTFTMSRDMAKGICQHFMDARFIENAADLGNPHFKDRGVYMATAKGLHVLERFITKNGIAADHIVRIFADQPICMKLLHIERRSADDEIIITKSVIEVLWRRFLGRDPNVTRLSDDDVAAQVASRFYAKTTIAPGEEVDRAKGILLRKNPIPASERKNGGVQDEYTMSALSAIDWICDYTSCVGEDEAGDVCAQFVRYGFLALAHDKGKPRDTDMITTVKAGGAGGGAGAKMQEAEFRATARAVYRVTKDGMVAGKWEIAGLSPQSKPGSLHNTSKANLQADTASAKATPRPSQSDDNVVRVISPKPIETKESTRTASPALSSEKDPANPKDSHTSRLRHVLDELALRSLFREFLRANFCEENLSYWLDIQDFKAKFRTTSSTAIAEINEKVKTTGHIAMEKHQQDLLAMAMVIYNTYLAPASPCELNIDHTLRAEVISYMNQIASEQDAEVKAEIAPGVGNVLHASQLQNVVKLYERVQMHVYRLMATDSVPKFCKTQRFLEVLKTVSEYNEKHWNDDAADHKLVLSNGEEGSPTRAYLTISQAANEKAVAAEKLKEREKEKDSKKARYWT